jgi:DNA-binding Xre family transcriptional regulator
MLTLNLTPIFKARGIHSPLAELKKAGIPKDSAVALIAGRKVNISCRQIEIICQLLVCEPSDLFMYSPDKNHLLPDDHPLQRLQQKEYEQPVQDALASISYRKLKQWIADSAKEK